MAAKEPAKEPDSLSMWLERVNKDYGAGTVMRLGDDPRQPTEVIPTGSIGLDEALGIGGLPRGRIIECYGPESSGKTSLALRAAGQAQRMGLLAGFIDAEHSLDPDWATVLGVKTEKDEDGPGLVLSQPDNGEAGLEVAERMASSGLFGIVIVDSVAALVPRAEIEGSMGDAHVGLQARLMSQALRKLAPVCAGSKTTIVFINQLREKIGVFFGSPETTTGGKALKFYASIRLDIRRIETLKDGAESVGNRVKVKVVKNKTAPPFRTAELDLMFGGGFSREGELIDLGTERGVVKKSGAWYTYDTQQLGQGKENARRFLADNPDTAALVEKAVRDAPPAPHAARPRRALASSPGAAPWDGG